MILVVAAVLACAALGAAIVWRVSRRKQIIATSAHAPIILSPPEGLPTSPLLELAPSFFLVGEPPEPQQVILQDEQPLRITALDFLTGSGKVAGRQELHLAGRRIELVIEDQFLRAVLRLEHNPWDGSGTLQLRFHAHRGDLQKKVIFALSIVPEIKLGEQGRMTECRRLVDFRQVPASLTSTLIQ